MLDCAAPVNEGWLLILVFVLVIKEFYILGGTFLRMVLFFSFLNPLEFNVNTHVLVLQNTNENGPEWNEFISHKKPKLF